MSAGAGFFFGALALAYRQCRSSKKLLITFLAPAIQSRYTRNGTRGRRSARPDPR